MTTQPLPPARLYVLLARVARVGMILRRGPTDWVQMIHWDTRKDTFTLGQWFHGKVYPEKSDISPDGSLIIYFAGKFGKQSDPMKRAWTAISKPLISLLFVFGFRTAPILVVVYLKMTSRFGITELQASFTLRKLFLVKA